MTNKLKNYFPMLWSREKLLEKIRQDSYLKAEFDEWKTEKQEEFLNFCTGVKGVKILYDSFFKEVMSPEYDKQRLEDFLSVLLQKKVNIVSILPNDSTRIADESSLLITDIIVELEDGSVANVEIQKVGYKFPAQRSACYSSDMMLRQYKRTRSRYKKNFSYSYIKNVYLIVIYEKSPLELRKMPDAYYHFGETTFNTGLQMNMLQKYVMISLDNFRNSMENKNIETDLEAWLTFLSSDEPERIVELIERFPRFKPMYETLYQMCQEVENAMGFFSEELRIMDRNTVKLMIEEQQEELDELQKQLEENKQELVAQKDKLELNKRKLDKNKQELDKNKQELDKSKQELDKNKQELDKSKHELDESKQKLKEKDEENKQLKEEIDRLYKLLGKS